MSGTESAQSLGQANDRTTYQYDSADRRTAILRQNGNRTTIVYDNASQITTLVHRNAFGTPIANFTYGYDTAGTRTSVAESGVTVNETKVMKQRCQEPNLRNLLAKRVNLHV